MSFFKKFHFYINLSKSDAVNSERKHTAEHIVHNIV